MAITAVVVAAVEVLFIWSAPHRKMEVCSPSMAVRPARTVVHELRPEVEAVATLVAAAPAADQTPRQPPVAMAASFEQYLLNQQAYSRRTTWMGILRK